MARNRPTDDFSHSQTSTQAPAEENAPATSAESPTGVLNEADRAALDYVDPASDRLKDPTAWLYPGLTPRMPPGCTGRTFGNQELAQAYADERSQKGYYTHVRSWNDHGYVIWQALYSRRPIDNT